MNRKPRLLFTSDSAQINTGFGRVTREIITYLLKTDKYEISQHAWFSQNPQCELPIKIYPTKKHPTNGFIAEDIYGKLSFTDVVMEVRPDLVFALGNSFMIESTVTSNLRDTYRLIHYVPVDHFHPSETWANVIGKCDELYLFCPWAEEIMKKSIPDLKIAGTVPHGIDTETFRPLPREAKVRLRQLLGIPQDAFVVGFIGRNLERKRLDQVIMAAAHLHFGTYSIRKNGTCIPFKYDKYGQLVPQVEGKTAEKKNVHLLLHVPANDNGGPDLSPLIKHLGFESRIHNDMTYKVSEGRPDKDLNAFYNCMDVFYSPAMGGCEMTNMEAMSAAVPLVVGNYSAAPDFCSAGSLLVEAENWIVDNRAGLLRAIPDMGQALTHLKYLMDNPQKAQILGAKGRDAALELKWDIVNKKWESIIDNLLVSK